ncbi:hypothetical protein BV22DRAFT_1046913 [Leucogyrophana mollusca]|uniref:Uncharacterized protein n=1 Tax=Leucogyrophana mollusca TaxID=85980 RepID=A0ACB8BI28_9AGAM|nr:hypothetical protein BV22DRAFT_1046913 [Leucogyrophana mollusca]
MNKARTYKAWACRLGVPPVIVNTRLSDLRALGSGLLLHNSGTLGMTGPTLHSDDSATVLLESSTGHGGAFKISSEAYNGSIAIGVHDSPMYSHLECTAHAVKGNMTVNMHPAFEGQFEVCTPKGRPVLGQYNPVSIEESVHMGRKRVVDEFVTGTKDSIAGTVYWPDEGVSYRRGGFVDVKTTGGEAWACRLGVPPVIVDTRLSDLRALGGGLLLHNGGTLGMTGGMSFEGRWERLYDKR